MITELEKQFYKTFEIEPIPIKNYGYWLIKGSITENDKGEKVVYPEISDRKLLEMICIYSKYTIFCLPINAGDFEEKWTYEKLKNYILKELICLYKANIYNTNQKLQSNIQQLFKGEEC